MTGTHRPALPALAALLLAGGALSACGGETPLAEASEEALEVASVDVGIAVGEQAPLDLPLMDSAGNATTLAGQMGANGLVLLLTRSADWCPYCKAQLIRTIEIEGAVGARGYALASLSYDRPETLVDFAEAQGIGYTMLSDTQSETIDALGLRDPQYEQGSKAFGVPRAAVLVLSPGGTVLAKHVAADFRERPGNAGVLAIVDGVEG